MTSEEVDAAIKELEQRLDRLRSLYEQYFLGIEKIEPTVARTDVDRRIWALRKQQIRNTARRFRLQTIVQRYNTFQQYWMRICREIDNGTYKRHRIKAEKRFGSGPLTIAARKRFRHQEAEAETQAADAQQSAADDLAQMLDANLDPDAAAREALAAFEGDSVDAAFDNLLGGGAATAKPEPTPARKPPPLPRGARKPPLPSSATKPKDAGPPPQAADAQPAKKSFMPMPAGARPRPNSGQQPAPAPPRRPAAPSAARSPVKRPPLPAGDKPGLRKPPAARPANLSDQRIQQLHSDLLQAKQKLRQSDAVSLEGLRSSLRNTESKLLKKHEGKQVDFRVVVKDGRAILKPIIR